MSRKANIICIVICVVVTLALIGGIIYGVVRNSNDTPPDETQPPVTDTTEPEDSDTETTTPTIPNIPDIDPDETGDNDQKPANPGDVTIDVEKGDGETERSDDPTIDGEVVIIPGVKGEDE